MTAIRRPLQGCAVGLSISESDDSTQRGFPSWQVNRVTIQVVAALFGQGAAVVFGHDWRDDGVMEAVHRFALQMEPPPLIGAAEANQPLLQNLLPWPDQPRLSAEEREQLAATLSVEEAGLPQELAAEGAEKQRSGIEDPYLRARGLTHLRKRLNEKINARFCLGGRTGGSQGLFPGVIEEAMIALETRKPLYLAGLLGGATKQMVDAIEGLPLPDGFCRPTKVSKYYILRGDWVPAPEAVWRAFRADGLARLAEANLLSAEENVELFHTSSLDRAIDLVLTGLGRLRNRGADHHRSEGGFRSSP